MSTHGMLPSNDIVVVEDAHGGKLDWQHLVGAAQAAWASGDFDSAGVYFEELRQQATPFLIAIATSKGAGTEAPECVAAAFVALLVKVQNAERITDVKALLAIIVRRRAIDLIRQRHGVQVEVVDDSFWERRVEEETEGGTDDFTDLENRLTAQAISNSILSRLSSEHREVLVARYLLELSVAETAARLGLTEDQVKKRSQQACYEGRRHAVALGLLEDLPFEVTQ